MDAIKNFIGVKVIYDRDGQYIWGLDQEGNYQKIADLRGWGAIQHLFMDKKGGLDTEAAEDFQDALGEWIVDAINEKLKDKL